MNEVRLIDANALKEDLAKEIKTNDMGLWLKILLVIDNAPTVDPCYQTTSCLDCDNYDKENHNCPRYCELIRDAIKSRPQGKWIKNVYSDGGYNFTCTNCSKLYTDNTDFCPNCGAPMVRGDENEDNNGYTGRLL